MICSKRSLICSCILEFVSSTSNFISAVNSVIWLSKASLIVSLIAVSSRSSSRNAADRTALIAFFGRPAIAATWWRHMARAAFDAGSPGGHSREYFSRYFLPSVASLISWYSSGMVMLPFLLLVVGPGLGAVSAVASPLEFEGINCF